MKKIRFIVFSFVILGFTGTVHAQVLTSKQVDSLVEKTLTAFEVPGIAVYKGEGSFTDPWFGPRFYTFN
ncbi:hypothetical protein H9X96_07250 [Pedobacter sp. N36a]|uniref:hypothetical protein n=1 Tax=Pedobacter sp. N36a TaxID=2767996 RepID=UPI001657350E|nr:hypothetical protein [Pedobacter sp. N36a]MBC8985569.1 hypothetical protein [Pedobacter sp. N36a]